jgi:hypothetical protein
MLSPAVLLAASLLAKLSAIGAIAGRHKPANSNPSKGRRRLGGRSIGSSSIIFIMVLGNGWHKPSF